MFSMMLIVWVSTKIAAPFLFLKLNDSGTDYNMCNAMHCLFPGPSCFCLFVCLFCNLSSDVLLADRGEKELLEKNCLDSD